MAKHDVTKTRFPSKFIDKIFGKFSGRRQIDTGKGTQSFAAISAAAYELSREPGGGGGRICPPLIGVRVKVDSIFEWICIDKHIYRRALSLCRQFAIKFFAAATLLQQRWRSGPPLRKFHWIVTSSCWFNRRQTSNWRYLSELPPSCYCRPMNDTTDANIVPMVPTTQERLHIVSTLVNTLYMLFSKKMIVGARLLGRQAIK